MKKPVLKTIAAAAVVTTLSTLALVAQPPRESKQVSAQDQAEIKALFKGVNPEAYRLEFNGGKAVAGTKKISLGDVRATGKKVNPGETKADIVIAVQDEGVIFVFAITKHKEDLQGLLGKEKAERLTKIMAKYPGYQSMAAR